MYDIYTCMNNQQATSLGRYETEGVWLVRLMNHCHLFFKKAGLRCYMYAYTDNRYS